MGMPTRVREAYDRGDSEAIRRMRQKASRTRAKTVQRKRAERERLRDEELAAQDWYNERNEIDAKRAATAAAWQRRDHLLPEEEQLPF